MNKSVKIFMCTHSPYDFLPPLAIAVQGGAKLKDSVEGTIPDFGILGSISEKNPEYCELTVQYYAWKNEEADYYGFCHYRRFFCFDESVSKPYLVFDKIPKRKLNSLLSDGETIANTVSKYDIVVPRAENLGISVYDKYITSKYCYAEDMDLFISVLKNKYPYLAMYADEYLSDMHQYFCNMFIMKKELFFDYCNILFPLLEEFDQHKRMHGNFQADRTDGYLAERFLGIYLKFIKANGKSIYECSRLDTQCSLSKRVLYKFLPPESKIRLFIRKLINRLKKKRKQ